MRVYLTEKPSQGRALAEAMGARGGGHPIRVPDGQITWALGHLMELKDAQEYNQNYERWELSHLPIVPSPWQKKRAKDRAAEVRRVVAVLKKASEIVIATDAGREGELIARELIDEAFPKGKRPKIQRLWANALNPEALRKALARLAPGSQYEALGQAAEQRERADWLEGINLTRLLTLKCREYGSKGAISVGRVQTPTLAWIVRREREIENFKPETRFGLKGTAKGSSFAVEMEHWPDPNCLQESAMQAVAKAAEGMAGTIRKKIEQKKKGPPKPFELATLQAHASSKKGWGAQKTLDTAQHLYEQLKAISYPRTDGNAFDPSEWDTCNQVLDRLAKNEPQLQIPPKAKRQKRKGVFSTAALKGKDHDAIKPTTEAPAMQSIGDPDARWLYGEIAKRFALQFMDDWCYEAIELRFAPTEEGKPEFTAKGIRTLSPGWKAVAGSDEQESPPLKNIPGGAPATMTGIQVESKTTKPPPYYTEGTLIARMRKEGVGTKATWAATIERLKKRPYILLKAKKLRPTEMGIDLIEKIIEPKVPELGEASHTASLEAALEKVAEGGITAEAVQNAAEKRIRRLVDGLKIENLPRIRTASPPPRAPGRKAPFRKKAGYKKAARKKAPRKKAAKRR